MVPFLSCFSSKREHVLSTHHVQAGSHEAGWWFTSLSRREEIGGWRPTGGSDHRLMEHVNSGLSLFKVYAFLLLEGASCSGRIWVIVRLFNSQWKMLSLPPGLSPESENVRWKLSKLLTPPLYRWGHRGLEIWRNLPMPFEPVSCKARNKITFHVCEAVPFLCHRLISGWNRSSPLPALVLCLITC